MASLEDASTFGSVVLGRSSEQRSHRSLSCLIASVVNATVTSHKHPERRDRPCSPVTPLMHFLSAALRLRLRSS